MSGLRGWFRASLGFAAGFCVVASVVGAAAQQSVSPNYDGTLRQYAPTAPAAANMLPPSGGGLAAPGNSPVRSLGPAQTLAPVTAAPVLPSAPGQQPGQNAAGVGQVTLALAARYGRDNTTPITSGLLWRIFAAKPDPTGTFHPLKEERSANPVLALPPGDYVVHVSYGLASAAKAVHLRDAAREIFDIPAGGVRAEGRVGDARIPAGQISFDIYKGSQFDTGSRAPLVQGFSTGEVVVVPEGVYYIVSNYGDSNAVVRSDIRVQAGKLTDVTVNHRAALITLKLVTNSGGEAFANTNWSVITPGGDVIKESIGAFPRVVLAEGDYHAIARNEGHTYEREFKVVAGVDGEVEVLAR